METRTLSAPILVAEDDQAIRELMRSLLTDEGYRVVMACDGAEALTKVATERPALLILDMGLPGLSGSAVVATLRLRGDRMPTMVMTASADAQGAAKAIGAESYIAKPFDCWQLLREVRRLAGDRPPAAS